MTSALGLPTAPCCPREFNVTMPPPVLRAPNGVVQDFRTYWMSGKPLYQPSDITVPTMLIHAEWDADLPTYHTMAYFAELKNAPYKRWVELGGRTS